MAVPVEVPSPRMTTVTPLSDSPGVPLISMYSLLPVPVRISLSVRSAYVAAVMVRAAVPIIVMNRIVIVSVGGMRIGRLPCTARGRERV